MNTVAIVCEYNPFHSGHKHHIDEIRREFGEDTRIIAIMSGNYTQRGETAIMDKTDRARCAAVEGANLVLELPFPFSVSSAELFARAGVSIADSLGIVDYLSFGSESGDISALCEYAKRTASPEYLSLLDEKMRDSAYASLGYPRICELAFSELYGDTGVRLTPNNILAVEYIKAIASLNCRTLPHTVRREGAAYNDESLNGYTHESASAIRRAALNGEEGALDSIPKRARSVVQDALARGAFPCDMEKLAPAILSFFRLNPTDSAANIHDVGGGLYNRIRNASFEADSIKALISLSETKKYTNARILRGVIYSFLGVTSSDVKEIPAYTQLLAMDGIGRSCLKEIRGKGSIPVVTKPSDTDGLTDAARAQKARADRADSIFHLTRPTPESGSFSLKFTPFVKP